MKIIAAIILAVMAYTASAWAGSVGDAVEVRIVTDEGRTLPTYPVMTKHALKKVYAEAVKGDHYRIEGPRGVFTGKDGCFRGREEGGRNHPFQVRVTFNPLPAGCRELRQAAPPLPQPSVG